ncbi:DUF292-domain-containing protein [Ascodesmis nigricans]|uniref:DUF292-domain-containing protein n=1 Tax=Ascodesmis nigricans TaxID=341454 RepID=A0A4S2MM46_9PEZI|nr:DUF292-domain-containing protein [Ascodesmis nigricans]
MAPVSPVISKLKVALKLSISRLRMAQQKEEALAKVNRRQMAQLLENGKEESARIRVENVIRQDIAVELMEILELYCELLLARIGLLDAKECDPGLEEAVKSLIYAAPRSEIKELHQVRQLLVEKYGKEFAMTAIENSDGKVSERVLKKLRVEPPEERLVMLYLKEIARTYNIEWGVTPSTPPPPGDDDDEPSTGLKERTKEAPLSVDGKEAELSLATPPKALRSPIHVAPPSPTTENLHPIIKMPDPPRFQAKPPVLAKPVARPAPITKPSDDDDLARRFAALGGLKK